MLANTSIYEFVPLHVRSAYSMRFGPTPLPRLVERAAALGYRALALTDADGLYGAAFFEEAARERGIRPIIGCHLTGASCAFQGAGGGDEAVLLARDRAGYATLCRLITRRHARGVAFRMGEAFSEIGAEGLFVLVRSERLLRRLAPRIGAASLFAEVVRPAPCGADRRLLDAAGALGVRPCASLDVCFADPGEAEVQRTLLAIAGRTTVDRVASCPLPPGEGSRRLPAPPDRHLRPPAEAAALFRDLPEALSTAREIAERCDLALRRGRGDPWVFPPFGPVPPGETAASYLRGLAESGLAWRYPVPSVEARQRLGRELSVIERLGFAGYFLVVRDIVHWARARGHPIAGRGSGASSLVAYVLGITNVCPLRFAIPFERFLHEARLDPPDLDIDFSWRVRDEVLARVFRRFGEDRAAMVSTHITFQPRSAFREAARASGLSDEQVSALKRLLPQEIDLDLALPIPASTLRALPIGEEAFGAIIRRAQGICGLPSHLSVHPGGVVITEDPIDRHAPIEPARKEIPRAAPEPGGGAADGEGATLAGLLGHAVPILQYEKDQTEALGLVKIDLLGNRALSTIREAVEWARKTDGIAVDVEVLPPEDPATIALLRRGDTLGANQLESPAMRHLLRMLRPRSAVCVMQALALIRPGAAGIGMKDRFVRRHRGEEPSVIPHPALTPVLGDTHGIMLYEDDAMLVASALTGLPLAEADSFRKRIKTCRTDEARRALAEELIVLGRGRAIPEEVVRDLWVQMAKFNAYSFCKGHAASYAVLAYAAAYLKAHHPVAFWVAALNNNQGLYEKRVYLEEAKRRGIPVLLPCVNRSGREFTADFPPLPPGEGLGVRDAAIRIGLDRIRGLSSTAIDAIIGERTHRPFRSLAEFQRRLPAIHPTDLAALIRCGAFDFTGRPRPALLLEALVQRSAARSQGPGDLLFDERSVRVPLPELGDHPDDRRWSHEMDLLDGLSARGHPLDVLRPRLALPRGLARACDLDRLVGRRVTLLGIVDTLRRVETSSGHGMEFLTLEDETGIFEVTLFPGVYRRHAALTRSIGPYLVRGVVEDHLGATALVADWLQRPQASGLRPQGEGPPRTRDHQPTEA